MNNQKLAKICRITGKLTIFAPVIALATQYPVIQNVAATAGGTAVSGILKMGIIIVLIANISRLKKLSTNPSALMVYGFIFGVCMALKELIDPLLLISGVGLAGSLTKEGLAYLASVLEGVNADEAFKEVMKGMLNEERGD